MDKDLYYVDEMLHYLHEKRRTYSIELEGYPKGHLITSRRGEKYNYFLVDDSKDDYRRVGISTKEDLIIDLCRKKYLQEVITALNNNIEILEKLKKRMLPTDVKSIISKLPKAYKTVPEKYFFKSLSDWQAQPYKQSTYMPEKKIHTASHGLKVRSKSELLIAEKLYEHDISFRYEQILMINGTEFAPDFTIRTDDGRIIYWEHCGLTNNKKYMSHHKWKMDIYEEAGIVPWKNLIVTYDSENGMLDLGIIESEIVNKVKI